jgi:hypothetical protein
MKRLLFISCILLVLTSCNKDEIYDEPGYAIGTITKTLSVSSVITYYYEYNVGNTTYKGKKNGGIDTSNGSGMVGRQYLVVYKLSEPSNSDLNFRYPINSEQDFLDLVAGFKDKPPKP